MIFKDKQRHRSSFGNLSKLDDVGLNWPMLGGVGHNFRHILERRST